VVDGEGRLLGLITVDDALDVLVPEEWKPRLPRILR
jgi:Mg/Co/Ni transporter MgtE